ncbi:MAG: NUDIX hydrolase [Patescibacteria group bacterium]|jgi:8-oxo-dGTP pyrophosphatase MutT (NUDIX family)|nr:NUDIX hydrolase [Patescibacteria group bacterium]
MSGKQPKRIISILIPFRRDDNKFLVFLQKRSKDAKRLPDFFGFFGGGAENGETPEETLKREMIEEINFLPDGYTYFNKYNFPRSIKSIYYIEVDDGFEKQIEIKEGEYGKYFTEEEALSEPKLIEEDKIVLRDLFSALRF